MSASEQGLGGRLSLLEPDALSAAQRELFDRITATAVPWADRSGFVANTADGRLIGPFNPTLLSPEIAAEFLKLQATEEHCTSLDERVRQVVILTVGSVWHAPYELYAHSAVARHVCLSEPVIAELVAGGLPTDLTDVEKTAHRLAKALSTTHHVDDDLYHQAEKTLGAAGVFEVAALTGIYHTVCGILNVFDIPAP
ncbi:MAG TPA: carboxymuconolactone decarboxylase family protein [Mycobacterium sp.]|jgi:4-carboxymuconolactone decarboxylase